MSGDLLVEYKLAKGGTVPELFLYRWQDGTEDTPAACEASNSYPCWSARVNLTASGSAEGSVNTTQITAGNADGLGQLDAFTFGEASIDASVIFDSGECQSFGSAYLKSRSSDSFTAALKDYIAPQPINLSNCGQVTVVKNTVGGDDTFGFTSTLAVPPPGDGEPPLDPDPADFDLTTSGGTASTTITNVIAGEDYTITESDLPAGWTLTNSTCADADGTIVPDSTSDTVMFDLAIGQNVTCTFTNTAQGTIAVMKQTLPDGDSATFDFTGDITATLGDGQTSTPVSVLPGTYSASETVPDGWALTGIGCSDGNSSGTGNTATFVVAAGEDVVCTFTNTKDGSIKVTKQTDPDGDPATFDFTGDLVGTIGDGGSLSTGVAPGSHSVSESDAPGWDLTDITCSDDDSGGNTGTRTASFDVSPGEDVECTFTNQKDANIVITKQTLPDGAVQSFTFDADYDGDGFSLADGASDDSGDLDPGTYDVTELVPTGWDLASLTCSDTGDAEGASSVDLETETASVNLQAGETVNCTFTNRQDGSITIAKETIPDNDDADFTFTGDVGGILSDGETASQSVDPGQYTSTEGALAGWDLTSLVCDDGNSSGDVETATATFNVEAGENVTCTFTNTKRSQIDVKKVDDAGNPLEGVTFSLWLDTPTIGVFDDAVDTDTGEDCTTDASGECSFTNLVPGTYFVVEDAPPAGHVGADPIAVNLAAGDLDASYEAEFVNERLHKAIVLTCHMGTDDLVASDVTLDGETIVSAVADDLVGTDLEGLQDALCALAGFDELGHEEIDLGVDVGSVGGVVHGGVTP
nr:prealbumin-like fold domain-containing protein [Salsipaludibacter albus]